MYNKGFYPGTDSCLLEQFQMLLCGRAVVLKMWSLDVSPTWAFVRNVNTWARTQTSCINFWRWGCVLTRLPDDSDACKSLRTAIVGNPCNGWSEKKRKEIAKELGWTFRINRWCREGGWGMTKDMWGPNMKPDLSDEQKEEILVSCCCSMCRETRDGTAQDDFKVFCFML